MNLQAGLDLFDETGSLIARPPRIVPVLFVPAVVLWVPISADVDGLVTGIDPGYSQEAYGPQTWRNEVGIAPPLTLAALQRTWAEFTASVPDVGPSMHMSEVGHWPEDLISPELPPAPFSRMFESDWFSITEPILNAPPSRHLPVRNLFAERLFAIAQEWLDARPDPPNYVLDDDLVATLLDYARAGDESGFRELAVMRGVPAAEIGTMWDGTLKRLGKAK